MESTDTTKSRISGRSLNLLFSTIGGKIARRPYYFLITSLITFVILSTGVVFMKISRDPDWLFADVKGKAIMTRQLVERLFPLNTSIHADLVRVVSYSDIPIALITAKDGGSILRENVIREVDAMDNLLREAKVEWRGKMVNYSVLCAKGFKVCTENGLREIISNYRGIQRGTYKIKYPISFDGITYYYKEYISLLGGVKLDDEGFVKDIKALRPYYLLDTSDRSKHEAINKWLIVTNTLIRNNDFKHIDIVFLNKQTNYKDFEEITLEILKVGPFVIGAVLTFSAVTCMTNQWATSKPFLGISACLSAAMAVGSGFGIGFFLGIPYQDTQLSAAYIILAVEVDDAFMLIASWRTTNPTDSVPRRMEETFSKTAISVTITTLTNLISCCVGVTVSIPVFRLLCAATAFCFFFAYIYLIMFFGACLALSGYKEEEKYSTNAETCNQKKNAKGDVFMLCLRKNIGNLLTYGAAKIAVVIAYGAILGVGAWGCTLIKRGGVLNDALPATFSADRYLKMTYRYFDRYSAPVHVVIKDTVNYADQEIQSSIEALMQQFESHLHIADSSLRISWLRYYKIFAQLPQGKISFRGYNISHKQDFIDGLHEVFIKLPRAVQFQFDLAFNEECTDITASRFILLRKDIDSIETDIATYQDFYDIASKSELPVEIFGMTIHLMEQSWIIADVILWTASTTTVLCCLVFFAFSREFRSSLCLSLVVASIICNTIGFLYFWGVKIDLVTSIVLIVAIGFSINQPSHITFVFSSRHHLQREEKMKNAIYQTGFPLAQGALSTVLGLLPFLTSDLYVLTSGFKILCLAALLTFFHSLLIVPVMLDFFVVPTGVTTPVAQRGITTPLFHRKVNNTTDQHQMAFL